MARSDIKIDGAAFAVNSPVQISPSAIHFDISLFEMPGAEPWKVSPVPAQPFFRLRWKSLNPAIEHGVVNILTVSTPVLVQRTF